MIIVFLYFLSLIYSIYCQSVPPTILSNCSFLTNTYLFNSAVYDQIKFYNQTSLNLLASYSLSSSVSFFELGLIYEFSNLNSLVPFPILFNCANIVNSCQLKTITSTTITSRESESINVELTSFNFTTISKQFNQMGLYLKQGRYQLSNCTLNNRQYITDPKTIFYIEIQYEKSIGSSCDPMTDQCGSSLLTNCSSTSLKCTCLSSPNSLVSYSNSYYCADMMNLSNCTIFPSRCITWCNQTKNSLCICPTDTLKIQRNDFFLCELPVDSKNCSNYNNDNEDDPIRRCPLGQCCYNQQCIDCSLTTSKSTSLNSSFDHSLRIALGIIAGLLGTSVIILLSAFCWLRYRQKQQRLAAEKCLTNSSTSSSSLYISPIQQAQGKIPLAISHYRTDSFRQAVRSGNNNNNQSNHIIERVSTKRDSYMDEKTGWSSPTFSTLEYIIPTQTVELDIEKKPSNIYQIILPSTPVLTHAV